MKKSRLYSLDPRCKIMMMAVISTIAMFTKDIVFMAIILAITLLTLIVGGVEMKKIWGRSKRIFALIISLFLIQMIFRRTGDPLLVIGDFTVFYTDGVYLAALLSIRFMIILFAAQILLESEIQDYLLALVQMHIPYEIAFMVMTGLHFLPILREESLNVYYSIQLRGVEMKKASIVKKAKSYFRIALPILVSSMHRANEMSIAMEARGLRAYPERTYMRKLKFTKCDIFWTITYPIIIISLFISWRIFI